MAASPKMPCSHADLGFLRLSQPAQRAKGVLAPRGAETNHDISMLSRDREVAGLEVSAT
jgi:hypothetical protein